MLEGVPAQPGGGVTAAFSIPTIGIGAGPDCDGQVLVIHDMLGLTRDPLAKFVKVFAPLGDQAVAAARAYAEAVAAGIFPDGTHPYGSAAAHAARDPAELRAECARIRAAGRSLGLVPTMGALHAGHPS